MRLSSLGRRIKYHPLIQVLGRNKGNPRTLVLIEPLWGIPYNLIAPFATLYMYTQGVTDVQIGTILSITMVIQVFFSFFAGILADKLGRKFTTMMGDFFGWALACLVWSVSHNSGCSCWPPSSTVSSRSTRRPGTACSSRTPSPPTWWGCTPG